MPLPCSPWHITGRIHFHFSAQALASPKFWVRIPARLLAVPRQLPAPCCASAPRTPSTFVGEGGPACREGSAAPAMVPMAPESSPNLRWGGAQESPAPRHTLGPVCSDGLSREELPQESGAPQAGLWGSAGDLTPLVDDDPCGGPGRPRACLCRTSPAASPSRAQSLCVSPSVCLSLSLSLPLLSELPHDLVNTPASLYNPEPMHLKIKAVRWCPLPKLSSCSFLRPRGTPAGEGAGPHLASGFSPPPPGFSLQVAGSGLLSEALGTRC